MYREVCVAMYMYLYICFAHIYNVYIHIYVNMSTHTGLIIIHLKHKLPTRWIYFIDTVIFCFSTMLQKITP